MRTLTRRCARPGCSRAGSAGSRSGTATLPRHLEMTQRARKRNRRSRGSVRRKIVIGLRASCSARSWSRWVASRPTRSASGTRRRPSAHLKPIKEGSTSVVFAADGSRLGYIQSDTIRHPVEQQDDSEPPQVRHGRDRGQELLRARRRGLHVDRAGGLVRT